MSEIENVKDSYLLLETVTGKLVDIGNPQPDQISINDIAWALSRIPRFGAHTITAIPYNVAQHSLFVENEVRTILGGGTYEDELPAYIVAAVDSYNTDSKGTISDEELCLKALLHDAAEAYIGDIPSPVKKSSGSAELTEAIRVIESRLMAVIYETCGLTEPDVNERAIIKYADKIAQKIEANAFMVSRGVHWVGLPNVSLPKLQSFNEPLSSLASYGLFMDKFNKASYNVFSGKINKHINERNGGI